MCAAGFTVKTWDIISVLEMREGRDKDYVVPHKENCIHLLCFFVFNPDLHDSLQLTLTEVVKRQCPKSKKGYNQVREGL